MQTIKLLKQTNKDAVAKGVFFPEVWFLLGLSYLETSHADAAKRTKALELIHRAAQCDVDVAYSFLGHDAQEGEGGHDNHGSTCQPLSCSFSVGSKDLAIRYYRKAAAFENLDALESLKEMGVSLEPEQIDDVDSDTCQTVDLSSESESDDSGDDSEEEGPRAMAKRSGGRGRGSSRKKGDGGGGGGGSGNGRTE